MEMYDQQPQPPLQQPLGAAHVRPRLQAGEIVEGWVVGEITPFPRPPRALHPINAIYTADRFTPAEKNLLDRLLDTHYAPPTAQFVLALVEYPSGPITRWGRPHWSKVEIALRSAHEWAVPTAGGGAPQSAELRHLVEELAQQALKEGWEPLNRGAMWWSLRFRRPYARLGGSLRWK